MIQPYVVGIAGGSASGKSTLCQKLVHSLADLKLTVFHMDEYFLPEDQRPYVASPITGVTYRDDNHPDTVDLLQLEKDVRASIQEGTAEVILVEGLLTLQHDGIAALLDLKLFVDCPADERIVRRLRRNMAWGLSFDEISDVYLDLVRLRHAEYVEPSKLKADLILNGSAPSDTALSMVSSTIRGHVTRKPGNVNHPQH